MSLLSISVASVHKDSRFYWCGFQEHTDQINRLVVVILFLIWSWVRVSAPAADAAPAVVEDVRGYFSMIMALAVHTKAKRGHYFVIAANIKRTKTSEFPSRMSNLFLFGLG